jgi:hypothetical protein
MAGEIFVQLIVDYGDDEKVRALARYGRHARGCRDLYVQMICYCRRKLTDGFVPSEQLGVLVYPDGPKVGAADARRLAEVGLVEECPGGYRVLGYLKRNPAKVKVEADKAAKVAGALAANHRRWHEEKGRTDPRCALCVAPSVNGVGPPISSAIASPIGGLRVSANGSDSTETETETEKEPKDSPAPQAARSPGDDPLFTAFWAVYPLKKDKGHARRAWATAVRSGVDPALITAAAERYRDDPQRKPKFTAYASTWLNGERYHDVSEQGDAGGWWNN